MRKKTFGRVAVCVISLGAMIFGCNVLLQACTNVLVTKGASTDGSVMITYTADSAGFYATLELYPAADHAADAVIEVAEKGTIPQVPHTYQVLGSSGQGIMNEFQVAMAETTFGGREELQNKEGMLMYPLLMTLGLQRATTAREAIEVMTKLVEEYGYGDGGESISIADKNEAWVLEIIGMGEGNKGAVWMALRVPDGEISCHANQARIGEFPKNNPMICMYSKNVESFAIEKGYYDPASGKPFHFADAYAPADVKSKRVCEARVWSVYRRAAPSFNLSADYHRGVENAKPYPWAIKPDHKLTAADVMALMRDHYDGTEFDTTQGIDAGEYGMPRRWRPLYWKIDENDDKEYAWERPISTQQTGFSFVTQSRNWLPDAVGGVVWYGVDDSYLTCYFPLYCTINELPQSYVVGSINRFSNDSAWWVFNFVSNYANLKYSHMMPEIRAVQQELETKFFGLQPAVEKTAVELANGNPNLMQAYLTDYSVMQAEMVTMRWRELANYLVTKYNDGYVRSAEGQYPNVGYPKAWLERVIKERPTQFLLPAELKKDVPQPLQQPISSEQQQSLPPQPQTNNTTMPNVTVPTQPGIESNIEPVTSSDAIPATETENVAIDVVEESTQQTAVPTKAHYDIASDAAVQLLKNEEVNVWRNQVVSAMMIFKNTNKRAPETQEEFIEAIVKANSIILPELKDDCYYIYDVASESLMIECDSK